MDDVNIKFCFLYRDAANFKNYGKVIFSNPINLTLEQVQRSLVSNLIDGEYFYADKWKVPDLHSFIYNSQLDHDFHEFRCVELTNERPTVQRTVDEFLQLISF